jgi:hypothetical protein
MTRPVPESSGSVLEPAGEDAFGDDLDAGSGRDAAFEAHGVTDGAADLLAQRLRHAVRGVAGSKAARLQHHDLLSLEPGRVEQLQRHARGLARTRLGDEQGAGSVASASDRAGMIWSTGKSIALC